MQTCTSTAPIGMSQRLTVVATGRSNVLVRGAAITSNHLTVRWEPARKTPRSCARGWMPVLTHRALAKPYRAVNGKHDRMVGLANEAAALPYGLIHVSDFHAPGRVEAQSHRRIGPILIQNGI